MISDAIEIPTKSPWDRNDKFPDPSYDNEAILKSLRTILKNSPMPKEKKDFAASVVKALFQVTAYKIRELDWEPNESYWVNIDSEEGGRKNIAFYPAQWDRLIQSWANRYYT